MNLTKEELRKIIKEELTAALDEKFVDHGKGPQLAGDRYRSDVKPGPEYQKRVVMKCKQLAAEESNHWGTYDPGDMGWAHTMGNIQSSQRQLGCDKAGQASKAAEE